MDIINNGQIRRNNSMNNDITLTKIYNNYVKFDAIDDIIREEWRSFAKVHTHEGFINKHKTDMCENDKYFENIFSAIYSAEKLENQYVYTYKYVFDKMIKKKLPFAELKSIGTYNHPNHENIFVYIDKCSIVIYDSKSDKNYDICIKNNNCAFNTVSRNEFLYVDKPIYKDKLTYENKPYQQQKIYFTKNYIVIYELISILTKDNEIIYSESLTSFNLITFKSNKVYEQQNVKAAELFTNFYIKPTKIINDFDKTTDDISMMTTYIFDNIVELSDNKFMLLFAKSYININKIKVLERYEQLEHGFGYIYMDSLDSKINDIPESEEILDDLEWNEPTANNTDIHEENCDENLGESREEKYENNNKQFQDINKEFKIMFERSLAHPIRKLNDDINFFKEEINKKIHNKYIEINISDKIKDVNKGTLISICPKKHSILYIAQSCDVKNIHEAMNPTKNIDFYYYDTNVNKNICSTTNLLIDWNCYGNNVCAIESNQIYNKYINATPYNEIYVRDFWYSIVEQEINPNYFNFITKYIYS